MEKQTISPPISIDSRAYRNTIGLFATGVTVVATGEGENIRAMTANAVTSLSLDPLLVIVCIGKEANCAEAIQEEKGFSISILRRDQEDLSTYFAGFWKDEKLPDFELIPWYGGPLLKDCLGAVGCELYEWLEGGDHWIVIGKVIAVYQDEEPADPLIFYRGQYRELAGEANAWL